MIFNSTKRHFSKCNGSWVVTIKQNMNFNLQPPSTFVFFVFIKTVPLKGDQLLLISRNTAFHIPKLIGASSESTEELWTSANLEWKLRDQNVLIQITFNGKNALPNFIKIY
jgi:hypothetical protein